MFSFLRNNLVSNGVLCFGKYSSLVKFISTDSNTQRTFAISYLINTCGVPKRKAISHPKLLHFKSSKKPDLVLAYLRENGFSNTHISKLIGKYPLLLLASVDKTLKPKFDFFKSQGISGPDFADVLCQDQHLLGVSLEKRIIPYFGIIKSLVHTDAKLLALLKRSPLVLVKDPQKILLPNIRLLRAQGVPADNIAKLLVAQPRTFLISISRLRDIVEEVKKRKFDPPQSMFLQALRVLASMTRSSLEAKFDVYRSWGLSQDEMHLMFRKSPGCLMISGRNIMSTMNYFVNEMGYSPSVIAKQPIVLSYCLKRRIIPRCSVVQMLKEKGLVWDNLNLCSFLQLTDDAFLKRYVIKFEKKVPQVLRVETYQRKGRVKV